MQRILMAFAIVLLLAGLAFAASDTWQNGGVDLHWATAGNWVGGGVPGTGDTATFDNNALDLPDTGPGGGTVSVTLTDAFTIDPITDLFHDDGTLLGTLDIQDDTTLADDFACGTFSMGANVAGASKTLTVGAGGFAMTAGTLSGTLTVDLSAAAGAYTQTAGTIGAGAVLSVIVGDSGWTSTALTNSGNFYLTVPVGKTVTSPWTIAAVLPSPRLTVDGTWNPSATTYARTLAGAGTVGGANLVTFLQPGENNFWTFTGTFSPATLRIAINSDRSNAAAINTGATNVTVDSSDNYTMTLTGGFSTTGSMTVKATADNKTTTVVSGGRVSAGSIVLGNTLGTNRCGVLTLPSGFVHVCSGTVAVAGTGTANALNLQGRLILGGTFTGTDIIVTPTYEGQVDCGGVGKVTAVTATGRRLIVRSAVHSTTGIPLRGWQDDSCVNVMFKGRKVIGEPGVN